MIALTNDATKFPAIEGETVVNGLEAMTGADALISPLDMPCTKLALIREHLDNNGAILIQVKIGLDLAASVGNRLAHSLIKMREVAPRQSQRVLLFAGTLACDADGKALIDGRRVDENVPGVNWAACQTSLEAWCERGGVVYQLSRANLLGHWLQAKEKRLKHYADNPREFFFPDKPELIENDADLASDPLQIPVKINDWRIPMAFLVGPKKAQLLFEAVQGHGGYAFKYISDPRMVEFMPKGIYKSDMDKFRQRMCLAPDEIIEVRKLVSDDY